MIAYYAHQHGSGHCRYAELMANLFGEQLVALTSCSYKFPEEIYHIKLPDENPDGSISEDNQISPPGYLHYSPVGQKSILERSLKILEIVRKRNVKLLIVDVSAEIAALARSASIPYAYVKLPGNRMDPAHVQAFQGAVFLIAYYPSSFEDPGTPGWIKEKTVYLGFQTSASFSSPSLNTSESILNIAVISGRGGNKHLESSLPALAERFENSNFQLYGDFSKKWKFPNFNYQGFVDNLEERISEADVIVANCGMNTISELLKSKKPLVIIPEERPFEEQIFMAQSLMREGLALNLEQTILSSDSEILQFPKKNLTIRKDKLEIFKYLVIDNFQSLPAIPLKFRTYQSTEAYEYI